MAIIIPWAASVVMTTTVFVYGLDPFYGIINKFLVDIHVLARAVRLHQGAAAGVPLVDLHRRVRLAAVHDLHDPRRVSRASRATCSRRRRWTAPARRAPTSASSCPTCANAIALASLINIINVFNSLPILKLMTGSIPGYKADTTTTYVFKLLQDEQRIDLSSALSVINFVIVLVIVALYLWIVKPMKEVT